jgi:hypothetical protein
MFIYNEYVKKKLEKSKEIDKNKKRKYSEAFLQPLDFKSKKKQKKLIVEPLVFVGLKYRSL